MRTQTLSKALLFWPLWIIGTAVGAVGLTLGLLVLGSIPALADGSWLLFLVILPLLTALIGIGQWLVLRTWLPHMERWILATIPGGLIFLALAMYDRTSIYIWQDIATFFPSVLPTPILVLTCLVSLLTGCCQWLVLRRDIHYAVWWLPVSVLSLGIGWPFGEALGEVLGISSVWSITLSWAITALISGLPLAWLMVSRRREHILRTG